MNPKTIVILAGGLGSRYKGFKQTDGMNRHGSTIMEYSVYDAIEAGFNKFVIVIYPLIPDEFKNSISEKIKSAGVEVFWAEQKLSDFVPQELDFPDRTKPWGTSHALLCAGEFVNENFFMINADDFYGTEIYVTAADSLKEIDESHAVQIAFPVGKTLSESGSVSRGLCEMNADGELLSIKEMTKVYRENGTVFYENEYGKTEIDENQLISMNFWGFSPAIFDELHSKFLDFLKNNPKNNEEFYIPGFVQSLIDENKLKVKVKESPSVWRGVTYASDKADFVEFLKSETEQNRYPDNLWS